MSDNTSRRSFLKGIVPVAAIAGMGLPAHAEQPPKASELSWEALKPIVKDQMKQFANLRLIGLQFGDKDRGTIEDAATDIDSMAHSILTPLRYNKVIYDFVVRWKDGSPTKGLKIGIKATEGKKFTIWDIDWSHLGLS